MPYDSVIKRGDTPNYSTAPGAHPLIPEETAKKIVKAPKQAKPKGSRRK